MKKILHGILSTILAENAMRRVNGRSASDRTTTSYGEVLNKCFDDLNVLGYKLENPRNLKEKHVKALCEYWYKDDKAVSTMQEYLSKLRVFSGWIDQPSMVKSLKHYLPDVSPKTLIVRKVAVQSKSWSEAGIDIIQKIKEADEIDERFGMMLRMILAFGLRRKEVTHTRPHKAHQGDKLVIYPGEAKNGRPRDIYIDNPQQLRVLEFVKERIGKNDYLGWKHTKSGQPASLKYNLSRYDAFMREIGITKDKVGATGHGGRAQFAENAALIAQFIPGTLGGTKGQKDKDDIKVLKQKISELMGHSRERVTSAYYGVLQKLDEEEERERFTRAIERFVQNTPNNVLQNVPKEKLDDCLELVKQLAQFEIDITLKQIYCLWKNHSERFGTEWIELYKGSAQGMEAAANSILRESQKQLALIECVKIQECRSAEATQQHSYISTEQRANKSNSTD